MKNEEIPPSALKSSSDYNQYSGAERSRLNEKREGNFYGGWAPKHADIGQWLQIDLGKATKITRIATQGRSDANWWVTKYKLSYSNGGRFLFYKNGEVKITEGTITMNDPFRIFRYECPKKTFCNHQYCIIKLSLKILHLYRPSNPLSCINVPYRTFHSSFRFVLSQHSYKFQNKLIFQHATPKVKALINYVY